MTRSGWSVDDVAEYDELVDRALREPVTADRRIVFLEGLDKALAEHSGAGSCIPTTCWAVSVDFGIRDAGADRILKTEQARRTPRVPVTHDGQVLGSAPREMGRQVRTAHGVVVYQRSFFDFLTYEELRIKQREFASSRDAAEADRLTVSKLLTLELLVPGSSAPAAACEALGVTVEEFLAS